MNAFYELGNIIIIIIHKEVINRKVMYYEDVSDIFPQS